MAGWSGVDRLGVGFALLAGVFWGAYILLSQRAGQVFPGGAGLALAMSFGAVVLLPVGIAGAGTDLLDPAALAVGAGVALLSSALPTRSSSRPCDGSRRERSGC